MEALGSRLKYVQIHDHRDLESEWGVLFTFFCIRILVCLNKISDIIIKNPSRTTKLLFTCDI